MKKLLFFFAMLMPLMASAEEWVEINGIKYIINSTSEDWSACVTAKEDDYGINSYKGKVTIPSSVAWNGYTYPVSRIIAQAFDGCVGLTSVTIPSSVTSIGDYAFSGCKNLTSVYCYATSVPELVDYGNNQFNEVSNYIPLYVPEKSVEAYKNSFAWSRNFRIIIPLGSEPPADVAINETNFPDANFRSFLLSQDYGTDGALSFEDLDQIYSLNVSNKGIQNMKGIEHFFALSYLYIYQNSIKGDGMDALVEGLPVIEEGDDTHHEIYAMYNSGEGNVMTAAQVAAAKAKGWTTRAFDGYYWMEYDPSANVAIDETNFPDENFRSWVLSQTYGADGVLTQSEATNVRQINVTDKSIKRLKGIEYFTAITILECSKNQIKGADMDELVECLPSGSSSRYMNVINNMNEQNVMTTTQVAAAKAKGWISYYNAGRDGWKEYAGSEPEPEPGPDSTSVVINAINFPDANFRSYLLEQSYGSDGVITVDEIAGITDLSLSGKNIETLEGIRYFKELTSLYCDNNKLTSLNVSACKKLNALLCNQNNLTSLNVSGCSELYWFYIYQNQIKGAAMDSLIESMPIVSNGQMFVIYCEGEGNVMTTAQVAAASAKGWVPAYNDGNNWRRYAGSEPDTLKCAKPTINYEDGKVTFSCATDGVTFHYYCYATYRADGVGDEIEFPQQQFIRIDVYASKEGYEDSETEIAVLPVGGTAGIKGDVNEDGTVNGTDIQEVINIIVNAD